MDEKDIKYRKGPPSEAELNLMKVYTLQLCQDIFNERFAQYGVRLKGTEYVFDTEEPHPVFEGSPDTQLVEKQSQEDINTQKLEDIISIGAKGLKAELDKYVISQDKAKKKLANKIIDHYRAILARKKGEPINIEKENIFLIGNTSVGKTYIIKRLLEELSAKELNIPFVIIDSTNHTSEGYTGDKVDNIIRQDLLRAANYNLELAEIGIVYIDEIDKIFASQNSSGPDITGDKVQSALLSLIEEKEVKIIPPEDREGQRKLQEQIRLGNIVKGTINTKNILFILGGSFSSGRKGRSLLGYIEERLQKEQRYYENMEIEHSDLVKYGMRSELVARVPIRIVFNDLTVEDLYNILKKDTPDSLVNQKKEKFKLIGIDLNFKDDALREMAESANLEEGARGLKSVMDNTLGDYSFELEKRVLPELTVTKSMVKNPEKELKELIEKLDKTCKTKAIQEDTVGTS